VIAVCGEALVDLLPTGPDTYLVSPGGSPANTAVALARLGAPVCLIARLAQDNFGRLLREHLMANGVDLAFAVAAEEPSTLAILSPGTDGDVAYRFVVDGTADWQWTDAELATPPGIVAVHAGSLALAAAPALERFLGRLPDRATISIDPNLRPALTTLEQARADVGRWLRLADLMKVSTEDLAFLHPNEDPQRIGRRWAAAGPGLIVVTDGPGGATAYWADQELHEPALPIPVVDTVGAGDTFSAGLLDAMLRAGRLGGRLRDLTAEEVQTGLRRGLAAAAVTCSRPGADPPYARELPDL
jgi:fructokinase